MIIERKLSVIDVEVMMNAVAIEEYETIRPNGFDSYDK